MHASAHILYEAFCLAVEAATLTLSAYIILFLVIGSIVAHSIY